MLNKFGFFTLLIFTTFFSSAFVFAQTVLVTPTSQNINPGQSATVKIETKNINKCTITGKPYNNYNTIINGNILLRPTETTEYIFSCVDNAGKATSTKAKITIVPIASATGNQTTGGTGGTGSTQNTQAANLLNSLGNNIPKPQTQYSTQTLTNTANELCAKYTGYQSVYPPTTPASGGGGSVPVDLQNLAPYLIAINQNTLLVGNEIRQDNIFKYCTEYQNMARATARLAETAAKTVKNIADACYADEKCMRNRVLKSSVEQEMNYLCSDPVNGEALCKLSQNLFSATPPSESQTEIENQKKCNAILDSGFYAQECFMVTKSFANITEKYFAARDQIEISQNDITKQFAKADVMGARPCVETASGRPPEEVRFYEADCIRYRQEPSIINQEALRQITALPYTQAFSPSSVLGFDGVLDNINTRTREGNLIDPNISPSFGSNVGGTNPNVNPGVDLKSIEENYKKIATNIGVVIQLYDVAKLAYSSSTSVCKNLPVSTRRVAVEKIEANKKTYTDYLTGLKQMWDAAVAKPRENHSELITKINFDLKDKYNQSEIDKVYEAVKKLLQTCADANTGS